MKRLVLIAIVLLCGSVAFAQGTPDNEPPANEGVCDELMIATPGLYGLCIAFCEAQDCEPDFMATDPFAGCRPSSPRLLERYDAKKQSEDPQMPCYAPQPSCPCWTLTELNTLPFPSQDDFTDCGKDGTGNLDFWLLLNFDTGASVEVTTTEVDFLSGDSECFFRFIDDTHDIDRLFVIPPEDFATCEAQLNQAGAERGFDCFVN